MSYVIAWITPSWTEYGPAKALLDQHAPLIAWEDDAPTSPSDPTEYYYCRKTIKEHDVYLVNAEKDHCIYRAVQIMTRELKLQGKNIRMFILGGIDYMANYSTMNLGIGDCVINTFFDEETEAIFQFIRGSIHEESRKDAKSLLNAVDCLLNNQYGYTIGDRTCYAHALYNQSQADIENRMFCLDELPYMLVLGLCEANLDQLELASRASAQTIMDILNKLEKLE
ncbi:hypothetical protein GGI43DRAFT_386615 [Trichoderma evansii]